MMPSVTRVLSGLIVVGMLGLPAQAQAQSISESVEKLTAVDAQTLAFESAKQGGYRRGRHYARTGREIARRAAVFGTIVGLAAGITIARYCREEGTSCPGSAMGGFAYGAGIGAVVGIATAR
jgi:hypothetical protein